MPEIWKALFALIIASLASTSGTVTLRIASESAQPSLAILGASLWGLSAAGFVYASRAGLELGTLATAMSAIGLVAINAVGICCFGDQLGTRKLVAIFLVIIAMVLFAWPSSKV